MAAEIQTAYAQTGRTLYALVRNSTGSVWSTVGSAFGAYATASLANYGILLAEQGTASRLYTATFPAAVAGVYGVTIYDRVAGSPAEGDPLVSAGDIHWNGSAVIPRGTLVDDAITAAKIAADAIGSSELAASAVTEIQAGLSSLDAAGIRAALGLASPNLDTQLTAIDDFLDTELAAVLAAVDTEVAAIKAKTDNLPSDPADASDIAGSFATINGKLDTIDDFLDTEVAGIKAKTDNLPSDPADESSVQAALATIAGYLDTEIAAIKAKTDNLPASPAATGAAMTLTGGERSTLAAAVLDLANGIETNHTLRQALRLILASAAGKLSGAATTTIAIRDVNDSTDRITATVDSDGNRSAVTTDMA